MTDQLIVERESLEKKDKSELLAIVSALGGKASSRSRKGELIDQVLDLSGAVETKSADSAAATSSDQSSGESGASSGDDSANDSKIEEAAVSAESGNGSDLSEGSRGRQRTQRGSKPEPMADWERELVEDGPKRRGGRGDQNGDASRADSDSSNRRSRRRGRGRGRDEGVDQAGVEPVPVEGYLDLRDEGYGFLRLDGCLPSKEDVYVPVKQVRTYELRKGDLLVGTSKPATRNEKNPGLAELNSVNGNEPEQNRGRSKFDDLTPLFPDERLVMERPNEPLNMTSRIIDLFTPIGKGQRGLIVSPPKAGKTSIVTEIAKSVEVNHPEVSLLMLLIDERPEEVTEAQRSLEWGEVVFSTFDRLPEEHCAVAELTIERAKRMVEEGKDVVVILDGITRLARAYNLAAPGTGRVMSGGVDSAALYPPKKFFGAARNVEEGGSLTILASALVDTGSKMDEVIFEEFKGTGNCELRLSRDLAERRIYPAVDALSSSTRREELLLDRKDMKTIWKLRQVLEGLGSGADSKPGAGIELLVERLSNFKTNSEFLAEMAKAPTL